MPNQFGLDHFDFADAYGEQKEHLCSKDLRSSWKSTAWPWIRARISIRGWPSAPIPTRTIFTIRPAPGSWPGISCPAPYKWEGDNADFTPESNDIPWSFVPEHKVTVEDVRYLLGSYYQGTPYNPYDKNAACKGKYRTIGVPNSDVCGIMQIRGTLPEAIQGVQWLSMGGSGFTACFPVYANVTEFPQILQRHNGNRLHGQHVLAQPAHCRADRRPLRERLVV